MDAIELQRWETAKRLARAHNLYLEVDGWAPDPSIMLTEMEGQLIAEFSSVTRAYDYVTGFVAGIAQEKGSKDDENA